MPAEFDLDDPDGTNGFKIDGSPAGGSSGYPVASAGDVNGDGFDDLIIGAPVADPYGRSDAGASYVVFGQAGGPDPYNLIVGRALLADTLGGESGQDLIRGRGGDDVLWGNDGEDIIFGGAGEDLSSGDVGDDILFIVLGENTLVFSNDEGSDTIVGYKPSVDHFDLTDVSGLTTFSDLSLTASGDDVLVDYGSGSFRLSDTSLSSIEAGDFLV